MTDQLVLIFHERTWFSGSPEFTPMGLVFDLSGPGFASFRQRTLFQNDE
jgi:hypothetical protein